MGNNILGINAMSDLRFPIGPFSMPESVEAQTRVAHLQALRDLPQQLRASVAGLSDTQLAVPYRPGGWNARQVVHHLGDSHMNCFIRFKLALTEDTPTIKPYDEAAWALLADSASAPLELSLTLIDVLQERWVMLLESLDEASWQRAFRHPEIGLVRLDQALALYAWHGAHHVAHITEMRTREGF